MKHRLILTIGIMVSVWMLSFQGPAFSGHENPQKPLKLTLDKAVSIALEKNPAILARAQEILASKKDADAAWADRWAKLSSGYTYARLKDEPFVIFKDIPGQNTFQVGKQDDIKWHVTITQPLFTGFALKTKEDLAKIGIDVASLEKAVSALNIERDVKYSYLNVLLAKRSLEVAHEAVCQLTSHVKDAKGFYRHGLIPYNDLLRSQVALAAAHQEEVRSASMMKTAKAALNVLLDQPVTTPLKLEDIQEIPSCSCDLKRLIDMGRITRPERKALALRLQQAELAIRLAKSGYYPTVALVGRYERHGDDLAAGDNDFQNSYNAIIGIEARWIPFEWGKVSYETQKSIHERDAIRYRLKSVDNEISLQIKQAWLRVNVARENIETARVALQQAKENYRLTNLQYKEQMAVSTDVLDARTFLTEAEMNYYSAVYGYHISLADLERAVGKRIDPF